jgi:hypothetical protein
LQFETANPATSPSGCRLELVRSAAAIHRLGNEREKRRNLRRLPGFRLSAILAQARGAPRKCGDAMTREEERELTLELERLKQEHRDLDSAIDALLGATGHDRIQVQRLKKRKLQLRDRIGAIEDQLFPDIIA